MESTHKTKKLNMKLIIIFLIILVLILGTVFWFINRSDGYDTYRTYEEKGKDVGEVKHYEEDKDNFFISIYYPKTKDKNLNSIINKDYKEFIKNEKVNKKSKDVLYMDYSIKETYKQYVNLNVTTKRFDSNDKQIKADNKVYTYDLKLQKILTVKDCLRNSFKNVLTSISGIDAVDENSSDISVNEKELVINSNKKNAIKINYEENKDMIKLANKSIPSNAPLNVAKPAEQPKIDQNKKLIAFTLDDGPHKTNTTRVVEMFEKYNGRATFLMLGKNAKLYPDVVKTVYEHGFEIGSHSWDHPDLRKLSADAVNKQVVDTQNEIFSITGFEPTIIRPPYGATNDTVKATIAANQLEIALWNVDTLDWKLKDANLIKDKILSEAYDGAVVLLHDIHTFSVDGLELALAELDKQGYQFVTLDTLNQYRQIKDVFY